MYYFDPPCAKHDFFSMTADAKLTCDKKITFRFFYYKKYVLFCDKLK